MHQFSVREMLSQTKTHFNLRITNVGIDSSERRVSGESIELIAVARDETLASLVHCLRNGA